jgi:predicted pyridoxine 5'-phosphate oxidase superfamily flavin-nucleotide-binding protein
MARFHELAFTPLVKAQQLQHNSRRQYERMEQAASPSNALDLEAQAFLQLRDSFYMASVSETGWPYVQHRGGLKGFVKVLNPGLIGFADLRGNKQYISLGNLEHDCRVALFFMGYPNQTRLKVFGRVKVHEDDAQSAALLATLRTKEPNAVPERALLIHVEAFDWNCPSTSARVTRYRKRNPSRKTPEAH